MSNRKQEAEGFKTCVVGAVFFLVWSSPRRGKDGLVRVTKVGRRWATLSNGLRLDLTSENWRDVYGEGYPSPGRLWDSEDQYLEYIEVQRIIREIEKQLSPFNRKAQTVSLANAREAARLLGVEGV
jgi:hypothetical protein